MRPRYRRVAGTTERRLGTSLFLANPERGTVHRVNETVAALWNLLATPATQAEAIATFRLAFPDIDQGELAGQVHAMLKDLLADGLVEPVP